MAAVAYLDTHVVAWLCAGQVELLTDRALRLLRDSDLLISPMVRLELQYLLLLHVTDGLVVEIDQVVPVLACQERDGATRVLVVLAGYHVRWQRAPLELLL